MDDTKAGIVKTLHSQQQSMAHILRDRMSKIDTGAISLFIAIDGWIIVNGTSLNPSHLRMLIIAVLVIAAVSIYAVHARYREFAAVGGMIVRVATAIGLYHKDAFIPGETLYDPIHTKLGQDDNDHSKNIYYSQAAIIAVFGSLSLALGMLA